MSALGDALEELARIFARPDEETIDEYFEGIQDCIGRGVETHKIFSIMRMYGFKGSRRDFRRLLRERGIDLSEER